MSSCLGLYIEENLIKYAKVTKDKDMLKVESFGIKFYDRIGDAIHQIITETYSYKTPISINLSEEVYNYFYFFNLLTKNDLKKAIETEYSSYCVEKGINRNALETRYALVPDLENKEKIKTIYIAANKTEINRKMQEFGEQPISMITSLPIAITNVAEIKPKENSIILNIESKTTLTMVTNGNVYQVDTIEQGMEEIIDMIAQKENSYTKAYNICKNTTIYTIEGKELLQEDSASEYLEYIMPTLYSIATKVKEYISNSLVKIDRIYITGTGSVINNIDLYFQESLAGIKCEILKPYFISSNVKINLKDYIEVNSAIALAMQGLGYGIKEMNFKKVSLAEQISRISSIEVGGKSGKRAKNSINIGGIFGNVDFKKSLRGELDNFEKWLVRLGVSIIEIILVYAIIVGMLSINMDDKLKEVQFSKNHTQEQIAKADKDITQMKNKTASYTSIIQNLERADIAQQQSNAEKNKIPDLLTNIMYCIPQGVTITSIENTMGTQSTEGEGEAINNSHITISAQSSKYELLGYFIGVLKDDVILKNVISTSGTNIDGTVKIVIEGDLP